MLMRQFLEGEGYGVVEAGDGREALGQVAEEAFDLVILDIAMPGMDGAEVCERINATMEEAPPVLIVTALDDDRTIERAYHAGAVDYIRKPLHWAVLKNRIRYILGAYRATHELEMLSRNYEMILATAANGICGVDREGRISYINPAALQMLGCSREEAACCHYTEIVRLAVVEDDDFSGDCCPFLSSGEAGDCVAVSYHEARIQRRDGTTFPVDFRANPIVWKTRLIGGVLVFQDITERQEAEEMIRYMANHDPLTKLPNRNYFQRRLPQAISLAKRFSRLLCLLFIDLDRFKPVNDQFGHRIGDIVLIRVAERLCRTLRAADFVCRLGGDEFVILLESTDTVEGAMMVAQKTIESLNEPIEAGDYLCHIGASIGISVFPDDCWDAETMLRNADVAMYEAKKKGRNCWQLYSSVPSEPVKGPVQSPG